MVAEFIRHAMHEVVEQVGDNLAKRAIRLIIENGITNHQRFPALSDAWPTIAPALSVLLKRDNVRLQGVCSLLTVFLEYTGRWDESLRLDHAAEAKAVEEQDYDQAGWRAYRAGNIYQLRCQAKEVHEYANRAFDHWEKAKAGNLELATAIQLRGHGFRLEKKFESALADYSKSVELFGSLHPQSSELAISLNWVGVTQMEAGDLAAAELSINEALMMSRVVGYDEGVATYTGNLAVIALERRDWKRGEETAREALSLSEIMGRKELIASDSHRIAIALLSQGRPGEARPFACRAFELYRELCSPDLHQAQATLAECESF